MTIDRGNLIEGGILWAATGLMVMYFLVFLFATWADRPRIGRNEYGELHINRPVWHV